jgi:DNA modification methylase
VSEVLTGHVLDRLAEMEPESVSCVVTSPPYWSLRKYDAPDVVWGGDNALADLPSDAQCEHEWDSEHVSQEIRTGLGLAALGERYRGGGHKQGQIERIEADRATCARCGAWRGQYGLEPTPELYVEHTLDVLRGIRRVLRPDGVVWWNIGDGYAAGGRGPGGSEKQRSNQGSELGRLIAPDGLKPKDLVLMPFRIALAAQADGWWLRSVVVWAKPNAMPESVTDRPTTAHEYVLMLTKSAKYWYDQEAVRQETVSLNPDHISYRPNSAEIAKNGRKEFHAGKNDVSARSYNPAGRNLRTVWTFPTAQTPEAHFATFPPELPRRAIEASCPREVCVRCGHARERVMETSYRSSTYGNSETPDVPMSNNPKRRTDGSFAYEERKLKDTKTTGWTSCDCAEPEYQPGLVLDPFCGVGTTLYVAKQLGRRAVGVELSERYADIARRKLSTWWAPGKITEPEVPEGQAALL